MFLPDGGQLRLPLFLDEYCILRFLVVTSFGEFARRPDALHQNLLRHRPKGVECRLCGPRFGRLAPLPATARRAGSIPSRHRR
jgi:hypothetical protein